MPHPVVATVRCETRRHRLIRLAFTGAIIAAVAIPVPILDVAQVGHAATTLTDTHGRRFVDIGDLNHDGRDEYDLVGSTR